MWFQRLNRSFKKFLIIYPIFAWFAFIMMIFSWDFRDLYEKTKVLAIMFLFYFCIWISAFIIVYVFYSLYLFFNKGIYHVQSWNWFFAKYFNFKRKKIWEYPIIIQYEWPEDLSSLEMAYLYNFRQFWSNISSVLYKWLYEKRIEIDFHYWKNNSIESFDIIDLHSKKMLYLDELHIWNLIFNMNKKVSLPSNEFYKNMWKISTFIAHSCYIKWYIEKCIVIDNSIKCKILLSLILLLLCFIFIIYFTIVWPRKFAVVALALWIDVCFILWIFSWFFEHNRVFFTRYRLSEKGKKALALIYGFKYFLEACDEKQIKALLEKDPEYVDKTMQYAAALGVNTEIFKVLIPWFIEWVNTNWFFWDIWNSALDAMRTD